VQRRSLTKARGHRAQAARDATVFDHAELDFNPLGHGPTDGQSGGYGVPHFDVHFFLSPWTASGRAAIRMGAAFNATSGGAAAVAEAAQRGAAAATQTFLAPPPAALLPSGDALVLDPESVVPLQGVHWVPAEDWASVYRRATHTGVLGAWSGLSYMFGSFNASITFLEMMVSVPKLSQLAAGRQSRREEAAVPQPAGPQADISEARTALRVRRCQRVPDVRAAAQAWGAKAFPTRFFVSYDNATDAFAFGWRFAAAPAP
jgi:hypothetical protein